MFKQLSAWILRLAGWKLMPPLEGEHPPRSIICVAPHTSNKDFLIGKLYYNATGKPSGFLMKRSWFFFPLGHLLRWMGGIPIDRSKKGDTVQRLASYIKSHKELHIAITPEGTRSYVEEWKTGFYRIALEAGIPIELATIDYARREVGVFEIFHPTGDIDSDMAYIRSKYRKEQACYPRKYYEYPA